MSAAGKAGWLAAAVVAALGYAAYDPQAVAKLSPALGEKARALQASLPESLRSWTRQPEAAKTAEQPRGGQQGGGQQRAPAAVVVGKAERKAVPLRIDSIGTVQAVASVAVRSRVDAQVEKVFIADGAAVTAGDILVKLDSRQVEAQIKQAEATLARDQATMDQNMRDVSRYTDLIAKQVGTQINLDNAKTTLAATKAAILADQAQIENLRVQLSWYTITAPITGRAGTVAMKAGNIVRSGDSSTTGTLVTINQTSPIYVVFSVAQRMLPEIREAIARGEAVTLATPQGAKKPVEGKVAVIDNAIDAATGTISIRAVFDNPDEILWPGQLCDVRVTLRTDPDLVTVPREAVQVGQNGYYVFVIENDVAKVKPVKLGRSIDNDTVITDGLKGTETVVIDGGMALTNNAKVDVRQPGQTKKGNS